MLILPSAQNIHQRQTVEEKELKGDSFGVNDRDCPLFVGLY